MKNFAQKYSVKLEPYVPSQDKINASNWATTEYLGQKKYFLDYRIFLEQMRKKHTGIQQTVFVCDYATHSDQFCS
jgi:hypothetical protein